MRQGIIELGALPLTETKVKALIKHCMGKAERSTCMREKLAYRRDALLWLYLWRSWQRGSEAGQLKWGRIRWVKDGIHISLGALKADQLASFSGSDFYSYDEAEEVAFCLPTGLKTFLELCALNQIDLKAGGGYVFRPLKEGASVAFANKAFTGSAMYARLVCQLEAAGLYDGESVHSFRRGAVRHAKDQGMPANERQKRGRWASQRTQDRYEEGPSKFLKFGQTE